MNDDDLSVRSRRGGLDDAAEKRFKLLLTSSREALLSHRAGLEFDAEDSLLPGDAELARRITDRVLAARPRPAAPPGRPWLKPTLGVAVLVGLAALIPLSKGRLSERPTAALAPPSPTATAPTSPLAPADAREDRAVPERGVGSAPAATVGVGPSSRSRPRPTVLSRPRSQPDTTALDESASALFARANRARRDADTATAETLYQLLQERYPASAEAIAADMALGLLALNAKRAELASKYFGSYLSRAPDGPLAADALWSRARALSLLGKSAAADESLRELLKRYPGSAYAGAARAKLPRAP